MAHGVLLIPIIIIIIVMTKHSCSIWCRTWHLVEDTNYGGICFEKWIFIATSMLQPIMSLYHVSKVQAIDGQIIQSNHFVLAVLMQTLYHFCIVDDQQGNSNIHGVSKRTAPFLFFRFLAISTVDSSDHWHSNLCQEIHEWTFLRHKLCIYTNFQLKCDLQRWTPCLHYDVNITSSARSATLKLVPSCKIQ